MGLLNGYEFKLALVNTCYLQVTTKLTSKLAYKNLNKSDIHTLLYLVFNYYYE